MKTPFELLDICEARNTERQEAVEQAVELTMIPGDTTLI